MKKCPKCNAEVDDNFDLCWNCQYSFVDQKILNDSNFKLTCPNCHTEIESSLSYCPHCQYELTKIHKENNERPQSPKHLDCIRCKVSLDYQGNF
ncbi:MAG: hypothetical protein HC906_16645 [Bacteroidales bacterium]|nr:hypothetical protein [Bacteroidales bacterium]